MEQRQFGRTDMKTSVLGFGGAEIGYEGADDATVERLLMTALDAGLNVIDTAECYANSEELIGKTIGHRRDDFHLFTKCGHQSGLEGADWDLDMLRRSIDRSLQRLQVDHVDVIHLHSCSEEILRQGDVISVLQQAKAAGKTRYIGYSGDANDALYAVECGAFDSLQTSVNIADQECITLTLPKASAAGMGIIAKRPIANTAWRSGTEKPSNDYINSYWERLNALDYGFLKSGMESAVSTALRFTLLQPGVCTAIVGTTKPERWHSNAQLLEAGPLNQMEHEMIRSRWTQVAKPDWVGQR